MDEGGAIMDVLPASLSHSFVDIFYFVLSRNVSVVASLVIVGIVLWLISWRLRMSTAVRPISSV